ncbi:oryzalexin D synthase-like [Hordeum vulgare subsp. vulgare]|uniref:oryzalexin D synthase-like n=1 Tax=Hordeum vulgare subsp. vulgare TaxID=112509 RepID=UPI001D1A3F1C|nr:oryzalexin D synthase-like [Hordeum vulgare subsp. vulgare]
MASELLLVWIALLAVPLLYHVLPYTRGGAPRWPPGPRPWPIVGNLLDLRGGNLHRNLARLAQTHGPVMMLKLGVVSTVFVSSRDAAWEAFNKYDRRIAARTIPDTRRAMAHADCSMVWLPSSDRLWKTLRGIAATHIFSPRSLLAAAQGARERAMHHMLDAFRLRAGQEVNIGHVLYHGMFDLLTNTLFSIDGQDKLRDLMEEIVGLLAEPNVSDMYPLLRVLDLQGLRRWTGTHMNRVFLVLEKIIDTRLVEGKHHQDVLDALLALMTTGKLSRREVKAMLFDILAAGTETTKITVEWAMAELVRNPGVMVVVRAEIKAALGHEKIITEVDVTKLPYLQAAVKESMRLHPVAPLLLPHLVVEEGVEIGGYAVPKGTTVIFNSWSIMRDPVAWDRPEEFMPERFLGKTELGMWGKDVKFIPLGTGRRLCPALPMVELLVPFMVASMLHAFEWQLPQGMSPD